MQGQRERQPIKYIAYHIHINGTYHCSARYSTLAKVYEALKREFGPEAVGEFPGKTFFFMSAAACDERRILLQRFLQRIAQNPAIINGPTFQSFLLNAQAEVQTGPEEEVQLEIYLCNGKTVKVDIMSTNQTDDVLETVSV